LRGRTIIFKPLAQFIFRSGAIGTFREGLNAPLSACAEFEFLSLSPLKSSNVTETKDVLCSFPSAQEGWATSDFAAAVASRA
jgi:hypothetical protein